MTQIKVEMTIDYFNNIYIYIYIKGRKKSKKRSVERMKEIENKRERMKGRVKASFSLDAPYMRFKKPFIGFTI